MSKIIILKALIVLGLCGSALAEGVIYVDADRPGGSNGSSWLTSHKYLQDALATASRGNEIWVAQGVYKPDQGGAVSSGDRAATFQLIDGVAIRGGYAGFGELDPDARDIEAYETILSGDLNGNDDPNFTGNDENSYHVVTGSGIISTAVLDGFTITCGNADAGTYPNGYGGGVCSDNYSDYVVSNCTFTGNSAYFLGGGMYNNEHTSPTVSNCTFSGNWANTGGGMCSDDYSSPAVINCTFAGNSSNSGGGMYNRYDSSPTLIGCVFTANQTQGFGGGIYNKHSSNPVLTNCIFTGNNANSGGGTADLYSSHPTLTNCTFVENSASGNGGGMYIGEDSNSIATNSIFRANTPDQIYLAGNGAVSITYSNIQGDWAGDGNISTDPYFVDAAGDDYHLTRQSLCIDTGDNSPVTAGTDADGNPRITDGTVDMGAYEFQGFIYVDASAGGANNGLSWDNAFVNLSDALSFAAGAFWVEEIHVAVGVYTPADPGGDRNATFQLVNGVAVKGGYAGLDEPNPNVRDIEAYETILSGDLNGDDVEVFDPDDLLTEPSRADNSRHVVTGSSLDATTVLDGFTITGGIAFRAGDQAGSDPNSQYSGGGMFNRVCSSPTVINCRFAANTGDYGGGMCNYAQSDPNATNCIFAGNRANKGGGMCNYDNYPNVTNCIFSGNSAGVNGGGMENENSYPILINCAFSWNRAGNNGGGIYDSAGSGSILTNCILWAGTDAGGNDESAQIYGAAPNVNYCCVQGLSGGLGGDGNTGADPLFIDPNGPDGIFGTTDDDLRLLAGSSGLDAGDNSAVTVGTDIDGNPRIINSAVDFGACEFSGLIYVDCANAADPEQNGTESHPFDTIQKGIDATADHAGLTVMVQAGDYVLTEAIDFDDKAITVTSADAPAVIRNPTGYAFLFHYIEGPNSILSNFILADGQSGIYLIDSKCSPTIRNLTIANNSKYGITCELGAAPGIMNCIFWGNELNDIKFLGDDNCRVSYSCTEQDIAGVGNIREEPNFVDAGGGDYRLKSEGWRWAENTGQGSIWTRDTVTSRCIGAGNPGSDLANEPLTTPLDPKNYYGENVRVNMGAYGGTAEASLPPYNWSLLADTNNDGTVQLADFAQQSQDWLANTSEQPGDLDRSNLVDIADFIFLANDWLRITDWVE